jgi:hypothetical protein
LSDAGNRPGLFQVCKFHASRAQRSGLPIIIEVRCESGDSSADGNGVDNSVAVLRFLNRPPCEVQWNVGKSRCDLPRARLRLAQRLPAASGTLPASRRFAMDESLKLVARERVRLDDVSYVVEVFADEGGCVGRWTCPRCGLSGRSAVKYAAASEGAAWAQRAAQVHHAAIHGDASAWFE